VAPPAEGGAENPKPDWSEIYADLLCHTSVGPFDIPNMTIPQIDAIRGKLGKNIAIKVGMPGLFGGALEAPAASSNPTGKPPKLSQFADFASVFNGI
jgi:hypothetical protein